MALQGFSQASEMPFGSSLYAFSKKGPLSQCSVLAILQFGGLEIQDPLAEPKKIKKRLNNPWEVLGHFPAYSPGLRSKTKIPSTTNRNKSEGLGHDFQHNCFHHNLFLFGYFFCAKNHFSLSKLTSAQTTKTHWNKHNKYKTNLFGCPKGCVCFLFESFLFLSRKTDIY